MIMDEKITERSLERRIKRYILGENRLFFAGCTPGFEKILEDELAVIPELKIEAVFNGGIEFSGPIDLMYFANFSVRSANRILLRIETLTIKSYPELFNKMKRISWELYLGMNPKFGFDVTSNKSRLHHTDNIASSMKEGIESYYRMLGISPDKTEEIEQMLYVRFFDDECTISIDTSGEHLHRRGYKKFSVDAPIRETIAASLLLQSRTNGIPVIIDPFCGSGTFLFELALLAQHVRPGIFRSFAFEKLPFFNDARWRRIRKILESSVETADFDILWLGFDIDPSAIRAAESNRAVSAEFSPITFKQADFFELKNTFGQSGMIISNPPYGRRIGGSFQAMTDFYTKMGNHLRSEFSGWDFLLILAHPDYEDALDLTIGREFTFSNGGIPVKAIWGRV